MQAYILGQNSGDYMDMVSSTKAVLFLATPHRGTHLAELLNRILSASMFNHSPKQYVSELSKTSPALEDLNEQFRHIASKLQIISFFETLPTSIGPKKIMVLEKNSSILGYPTEMSKSLNADHHNVCKYENTQDPNYISVRNALKTVLFKLRKTGQQLLGNEGNDQLKHVENFLLALPENPNEDLAFFRKRWTPGTCEWILSNPEYMEWLHSGADSKFIWVQALPATGKSILSSFIVNSLLETKEMCAYYFFRFSDQTKRSLSACLRSIAYQIAEQLPSFRRALYELTKTGVKLDKADARTIWQKVFTSLLFKMTLSDNLYWIIDGLDEADSPQLLVELIRSISTSVLPIKIMLLSRRSPDLVVAFERLATSGTIQNLKIEDNEHDIRKYVEQEIDYMHAPIDLKAQVIRKLLERANGNFLWVNLALTEILQCLTPEDIEETLEGLPTGMEELYHRMELLIMSFTKPRDQDLAKTILSWAACPRRPLHLDELEQALKPEFPVLLDPGFTINKVCGQFVVIDSSSQVVMVHQTAREYLLKSTESSLVIIPVEAHQKMFAKCMYFLDQNSQRRGPERHKSGHLNIEKEPFLNYAVTSWPYHLESSSAMSDESLVLLTKFLRSMSVLSWISSLADIGELKVLVNSSTALNTFVRRRRKYEAGTNPLLHRIQDLELVELWATDLIKVLGKFGPNLMRNPLSIYKQIPPFCPRDSMIHKQFGINASGLSVKGISSASWDDSLAKISLGSSAQTITIICSGDHFAILTIAGQIVISSTITFEVVYILNHGERVSAISFSHGCDRFVSSGFRTTKVWSVASGKVIMKFQNPPRTRALKIAFSADDNALVMGSADRGIRIAQLDVAEPIWAFVDQRLLNEDTSLDHTVTNSPCCITFSPDATHVAVAYRGFPLSVWSIDPPELVGRCRRSPTDPNKLWAPVDRMVWHPFSGEVLGLYLGGYVFKWHPYNGTHHEIYASASIIACSPEGTFFATGDATGTIKLYNFEQFALVYQLSCANVVNDIAFSSDSRRLYDLRGQFCDVWEPNTLLRLDYIDEQERSSDVGSEVVSLGTAAVSEATSELRDPITAISVQPGGAFYAAGDESGVVSIYDSSNPSSSPLELFRSASMLTTEHLDWGEDGQHIASAELGGKINVRHVTQSESDGKWVTKSIFDAKVEVEVGGIQQILLNSDSTMLLVGKHSSVTLLSVSSKFEAVSRSLPSQGSVARWIKHPYDRALLLAFSPDVVRIYKWHDLTQTAELNIVDGLREPLMYERPSLTRAEESNDSFADDNQRHFKPSRLMVTSTRSNILFQYNVTSNMESRYHQTMIFDTSIFHPSSPAASGSSIAAGILKPLVLPDEVETQVEIPLGVLPGNRFIYLGKDFSIYSLRVGQRGIDEKSVQEHFFLPRDWLNSACLELSTLLSDGTFLVPHNGEIAAIKSSIMLEW